MVTISMMTMDSPAHATCKPPLGSSSWNKNFQVSKPFFLSSTNLWLLPGCLQADKPRLWGRVSRSQSLEGEVGAGVEVLGWWELGLGLPEDTWRHQSRRWRRWGGGWGWWGRGRPASNCNREHSLGLTEGHVFPWKHSLLINALWWLSSSASWTNHIFTLMSPSASSLSVWSWTPLCPKIGDPGFPQKEWGTQMDTTLNTQYLNGQYCVIQYYNTQCPRYFRYQCVLPLSSNF